jgi:hypothetical protein
MTKDFFKIEIDGRQFKTAYLVYIVKLTSQTHGDFYYVGQTGDRHYMTARPAFRRLAGHLSDQGHSTENQIYRQIAVKILRIDTASAKRPFNQQTKDAVSDFLSNCKIEMFVHPLVNFLSTSDLDSHKSNRQLTEKVENELINYFIKQVGMERLLNKKLPKTKTLEFDPITTDIINHINSN